MNMKRFGCVLAAGVLAACGQAMAQSEPTEVQGSLDQPLVVESGSGVRMFLSEDDGATKYEVEVNGDKVVAKIDGKKIPAKRVKRSADKIQILGEDGEVLKTFDVQSSPLAGTLRTGRRAKPGEAWYVTPGFPQTPQPPAVIEMQEPPKTMIGIRMDDEAEGAVVLTAVIEGLPAAKAGLKEGDVLVSIGGKKIEKVTDIRESIKDNEPGDTVEFVVTRDGEEKKFKVKLEAWDSKTLYGEMPEGEMKTMREAFSIAGADTAKFAEEARKALEKALKEIQSSDAKAQFEKSWSDAMKQAIKALEQSKDDASKWMQGWSTTPAPSGRARVFGRTDQGGWVVTPDLPQRHSDMEQRLDELSQRLDQLNERLDKLVQKLEKKNP